MKMLAPLVEYLVGRRRGKKSAVAAVASSRKLRSRRGAAASMNGISNGGRQRRRRRGSDIFSAIILVFASAVVFGVATSWTFLFVRTLRGNVTRPVAPRDARRRKKKNAWGGISAMADMLGSFAASPKQRAARALEKIQDKLRDLPVDMIESGGEERGEHAIESIKLPSPVIVVGMPKSGTTSISSYFRCGGRKASHFACEASGALTEKQIAEMSLKEVQEAKLGDKWRNCRLPGGAGGPSASRGEYPLCGVCVRRNILRGRPPLEGCGDYEVWAELDSAEHPLPSALANFVRKKREREEKEREEAQKKMEEQAKQLEEEGGGEVTDAEIKELAEAVMMEHGEGTGATSEEEDEGESEKYDDKNEDEGDGYGGVRPLCAYPQVTDLDAIHNAYPDATFILNLRPVEKWIRSVSKWTGDKQRSGVGYLRQVLTRCDLPGLPAGKGGEDEDLVAFYNGHSERVREFARLHPSHALVEVNIEDVDAGKVMEEAFGISAECWTVRNASPGNENRGEGRLGRRDRAKDFAKRRRTERHRDEDGRYEDMLMESNEDVVERLRQRRRERMGRRDGDEKKEKGKIRMRRREDFEEERLNEQIDRNLKDDLKEEMLQNRRRRREQHREETLEERLDMRRRAREGRADRMERMLRMRGGGRSRLRFRRYPECTNVDDLFPMSTG